MIKKIPSNTTTFEYINLNPKQKRTTDCVVRAFCFVLNRPYNEVLMDMVNLSIKTGYHINDKTFIEKYAKLNGFVKYKQPKNCNNGKMTINECIKEKILPSKGVAIVTVSKHLTAYKDNKIYDIWDCTGLNVRNYWIKEN